MPPHSDLQVPRESNDDISVDFAQPFPSELHGRQGTLPDQAEAASNSDRNSANAVNRAVERLGRAIHDVHLAEKRELPNDAPESGNLKREFSFDDDHTHLSTSSTKPTSVGSKSLASLGTFPMDEKDSVRPDDSASVQAVDEEESLCGLASGAPNSLTGSESGARGPSHLREVNFQRPRILQDLGPVIDSGDESSNAAIPPDSVSNNFVVPSPGLLSDSRNLHGFPLEPDEKLLDAMNSQKDRLIILQLEDKVRHFVEHSKEQSLELPPSNGFGRLLAHKLGDYYHLTHFVDNATCVRLHRTPFCRLPTPLSALHAAHNNTPPSNVPAMKIMRRTDGERPSTDGSTGTSSPGPSKAASEAGDATDGGRTGSSTGAATPAKDRMIMTREEREAKYQEVRDRIFRDFPESKASDTSNGYLGDISRSSSSSGRKKASRQKTPHDDSFEVRSQYNAYYPGTQFANGLVPYQGMNGSAPQNQPPSFMVGPGAAPPGPGYVPSAQNGPMYSGQLPQHSIAAPPQMPSTSRWQGGSMPQQSPFSGYASTNQTPGMMNQQALSSSSAMSSHSFPNATPYQPTHWPSPYAGNFQKPAQRNPASMNWQNYAPQHPASPASYPYGQFPMQPMSPGMQNYAHPIPGSYNRAAFNPQTRAFVPGGSPLGRHPSCGSQPGVSPYAGMSQGNQPQWTGYHDASRNQEFAGYSNSYATRGMPLDNRGSIAKWGAPSHLPPKPPSAGVASFGPKGQDESMPAAPCGSHTLPDNTNGPFVVSGGMNLPNN